MTLNRAASLPPFSFNHTRTSRDRPVFVLRFIFYFHFISKPPITECHKSLYRLIYASPQSKSLLPYLIFPSAHTRASRRRREGIHTAHCLAASRRRSINHFCVLPPRQLGREWQLGRRWDCLQLCPAAARKPPAPSPRFPPREAQPPINRNFVEAKSGAQRPRRPLLPKNFS